MLSLVAYNIDWLRMPFSLSDVTQIFKKPRTHEESLMMQRITENDDIVTKYMDDSNFQKTIFPILAKEIYKSILEKQE